MSLAFRFRWPTRKSVDPNAPTHSVVERLDRYVTCIEQPKSESTANERMALRARLESAFDRW